MSEQEFKKRYPFFIAGRVEWADLDAFQHVNNTMYFRYFERVRLDYFIDVGFIELMREQDVGPILASTQCRFKLPLEYPDSILTGTYITDLQDDRFLMRYAVYSYEHDGIAAEGEGLIVCYDYEKKQKVNIPEAIRTKLSTL